MSFIRNLIKKYRYKGYVGPKYHGVVGKIKLLMQGFLGHTEVVVYAEPSFWKSNFSDIDIKNSFMNKLVRTYEESLPYLAILEEAYYIGFTKMWQSYFKQGQLLCLTFLHYKLAYFMWIQVGSQLGKCFYSPLKEKEYRLLRGGTLPEMRNKKALICGQIICLEHLFKNGVSRVYTEAYEDNIYSRKGHRAVGFREFGRVFVRKTLTGKTYIRWVNADEDIG